MALKGATTEEKIWLFLSGKGLNDYGIAGMMGNLYAESGLNPKNLQQTYEKKLKMTDEDYTYEVDGGTYKNFEKDGAGYGLAQWTYWTRKRGLLDFAEARNSSVGNLETQLEYLYKELSGSYKSVLAVLKSAKSVKEASDAVLKNYEKPKDQSAAVQKKRADYGQKYYDKYAAKKNESGIKTEAVVPMTREALLSVAQKYVGVKEGSSGHKKILDTYNNHKPLARGYTVKMDDEWCATFASMVAIEAGMTDIIPTECGCQKMIDLFTKKGSWEESDSHIPAPADYLFYDWQDNGKGDCKGHSDHVGIVESVSGGIITLIEGNWENAVSRKTLPVNGKFIRGYGIPKYAETDETTYTVKKGDTLWGIATKMLGKGNRYPEIKALNGLKDNIIHTGQVLKIPPK